MIITIDGPAGAGKSSVARALAQRLGFDFLDTGAMYRVVTLAGLRRGGALRDEPYLTEILDSIQLDMPGDRVLLDGEDVTHAIRDPAVTAASGPIASSPVVRRRLVDMQRTLAAGRNIVCEGRDQGTVVFPNAECKFFLSADAEERARRRLRDLSARGDVVTLDEVKRAQEERDRRDAARTIGPMVPATDAVLLDSTQMSLDEVVTRMEQIARTRMTV
jgi:cytidylate kinase